MQPPTNTRPSHVVRGDEEALYRQHHRNLERTVAHTVRAPRELIEDACQTAWTTLLRSQPKRPTIFAWLRVVAIHEAYRLSATERRDARLEHLNDDSGDWEALVADGRSLDAAAAPGALNRASGGQLHRSSLSRSERTNHHRPEPQMRHVLIAIDLLTPAERRDLANALLRAAWSAALEDTRILLLDLLLEVDE